MNQQATALFRKRYGASPNVMTPRLWDRRMVAAGRLAVELSEGDGFKPGDQLWGVTVLIAKDVRDPRGHDLSQAFTNRRDAEAYIESLRAWRDTEQVA